MTSFDATASLLGYLYQCRFALVESVRRLKVDPEFTVSIEHLDDVTFDVQGTGLELVQTKHHIDREADLTDYSPDIWKTLRVWATGIADGSIPADATFFLVTTGRADAASAAGKLGYAPSTRDAAAAKQRLDQVATTSQNVANAAGYKAYRDLSDAQRLTMLSRATVCDGRNRIEDLRGELGRELGFPVERRFMSAYMDRVEGWWFNRVVGHLRLPGGPILSQELDEQIRTRRPPPPHRPRPPGRRRPPRGHVPPARHPKRRAPPQQGRAHLRAAGRVVLPPPTTPR